MINLDKIKKRPILFLMLALGLSMFGFFVRGDIRYSLIKKNIYPGIAIRVDAAGLDAFKMEEEITSPIEKIISTVGGVSEIRSISESGKTMIHIQMNHNTDLKIKSLEFREKIDLISSGFPRDVHKPMIFRYDPTNSPLMVATFSSQSMSQDELREIIEKTYKAELENIEGVSQVIVAGGRVREIIVACDAKQLEAYSLNLRDIVNKIQDINVNQSLGQIHSVRNANSVYVKGKFSDTFDIGNMPVTVDAFGRVLYLKDVAKVSLSPRDDDVGSRLNAEERVSIFIYNNHSADILKISKLARSTLFSNQKYNLEIQISQDESLFLSNLLESIFKVSCILLFFFTVYFYPNKNFRKIIPFYSLAIPLVYFFFLLILRLFRLEMSLAFLYGMILGNIFWVIFWLGKIHFSGNELYIKKYNLFYLVPVVLLGISLPILIVSEELFRFFIEISASVCFVFVANSVYYSILYINLSGWKIFLWVKKEHIPNRKYHSKVYDFIIGKALDWRKKTEESILSHEYLLPVSILFLTIIGLYSFFKSDFKFTIQSDKRDAVAFLEFPSGTSFSHTSQITLAAEKKLLEIPGIKEVVSKIDPAHSLLLIQLEDGYLPDRDFLATLKTGIGSTDDGFLYFASDDDSKFFKEMSFDVIGYDISDLEKYSNQLAEKAKGMDGVSESVLRYKPSREEMQLYYRPYKFALSDMALPDFGDNLRLAIQGGVATKYMDGEKEVDIRVRYAEEYRSSADHLSQIRIKNRKDRFVPISELVDTEENMVPQKIYHKNRVRCLSFSVKLDAGPGSNRNELIQFMKSYSLPEGYRVEMGERAEENFLKEGVFQKLVFSMSLFVVCLSYFAVTGNGRRTWKLFTVIFPVFFFSVFLIQFFFFGAFYLPFQIGLLVGIALCPLFLFHKYHLTQFLFFLPTFLMVPVLMLSDVSIISFVHIYSSLLIVVLITGIKLRMEREWEKKYGELDMILMGRKLWEKILLLPIVEEWKKRLRRRG
ncbi:efflux RND transporter permease subunit [Leptospira idonii]|uniref:Efflux RND transporter permease subunit n=1 Tax=Leptospira idonii TaxID=1193500 RepID=A0A4R9LTJ3_9LEPT|nr:efflux RND transporter permease subunit [Leptospira idonii]TGN16945.1 hypothetical protein EHS15_18715 [Leptospira idonii]